jgi:hypothetical protein
MMFVGVQSGSNPHPSYRNRFITAWPVAVWDTSGWNCTATGPRSGSSMPAIGICVGVAVTRNPSGARVTASPCDIQTVSVAGQVLQHSVPAATRAAWSRRTRARPVAATSPPSAWAISWWP